MKAKKAKEAEELDALNEQIADLEEQLRVEKLRNRLNEEIIDDAGRSIEVAKKMFAMGFALEVIAQVTGLPLETLKGLK